MVLGGGIMKFFKKLKNVKLTLFVLLILALAFIYIHQIQKAFVWFLLVWLDLIVFLIIYGLYYRCPYCGGHLGKKYKDRIKCKNCGKKLK